MKTRYILAASLLLATTALAADKPQYGAWGFDTAGMDTHTKPGDDFFRYASGAWLDKAVIPARARRTMRSGSSRSAVRVPMTRSRSPATPSPSMSQAKTT